MRIPLWRILPNPALEDPPQSRSRHCPIRPRLLNILDPHPGSQPCLQERDWVLLQFKSGEIPILLATDVAARGLDVKDVRVVINYDAPSQVQSQLEKH